MKKSSLIPLLVIAGVGGYLLYKKRGAGSSLAPTSFTSPNVPITQLSPISTAGMIPISSTPFTALLPPTAPNNATGFWAGVQNFLNPGSAG